MLKVWLIKDHWINIDKKEYQNNIQHMYLNCLIFCEQNLSSKISVNFINEILLSKLLLFLSIMQQKISYSVFKKLYFWSIFFKLQIYFFQTMIISSFEWTDNIQILIMSFYTLSFSLLMNRFIINCSID